MAKVTYPQISHANQSWDAELESWRQNLQYRPLPVYRPTAGAFANLPTASQNDDGLAVIADATAGVIMALSNGTIWRKVPVQAAAQADSTAPDVATLKADFNSLLAKLRTAGVIAP